MAGKLPGENILMEKDEISGLDCNKPSVEERILDSGLFDSEFYVDTYGENLAGELSPIEHFLENGLERGYLPSAGFDPVLYRLLVPTCGRANQLLHYIENGDAVTIPLIDELLPAFDHIKKCFAKGSKVAAAEEKSSIIESLTGKVARRFKGQRAKEEERIDRLYDVSRNRTYASKISEERDIPFTVEGKNYSLKVPSADFFLDRLRSDSPFAFARLPHGFWEALLTLGQIEAELKDYPNAQQLTGVESRALAIRIGMALLPHHGAYIETFLNEVLEDIKSSSDHPDFFRSISFKGYPTWDENVFPDRFSKDEENERMAIFARFFEPSELLFDATLWKRFLISGDLKVLPELCRDRHVILFASDIFSELGQRWNLENFSHISIARTLSQKFRWDLLKRTREVIDEASREAGKRPIVLMQCGGSLAFWLISRLFKSHPDIFYIDLGQAINGWFFDSKELPEHAWEIIYKRSVIENCSLSSYYNDLKLQ